MFISLGRLPKWTTASAPANTSAHGVPGSDQRLALWTFLRGRFSVAALLRHADANGVHRAVPQHVPPEIQDQAIVLAVVYPETAVMSEAESLTFMPCGIRLARC